MAGKCTICYRNDRAKIDAAIARGDTFRVIAEEYGLTETSIGRHKKHITALVDKAQEKHDLTLVQRLVKMAEKALVVIEDAMTDDKRSIALAATRELRGFLEFFQVQAKNEKASDITEPTFYVFMREHPDIGAQYREWLKTHTEL